MKCIAIISILILLYGCGGTTLTGYEFRTTAIYIAQKSGVTTEVEATGNVDPGMDIGTGSTKCEIKLESTGQTINLETNTGKLKKISIGNDIQKISDSTDYYTAILSCMGSSGFKEYNEDEIRELEKVIKSAECGPKATYMKGQTRYLTVVKTDFKRQ